MPPFPLLLFASPNSTANHPYGCESPCSTKSCRCDKLLVCYLSLTPCFPSDLCLLLVSLMQELSPQELAEVKEALKSFLEPGQTLELTQKVRLHACFASPGRDCHVFKCRSFVLPVRFKMTGEPQYALCLRCSCGVVGRWT